MGTTKAAIVAHRRIIPVCRIATVRRILGKVKPALNRSLLHPDSNNAAAMNSDGTWFSYSQLPTIGADKWIKAPGSLSFRILKSRVSQWDGDWRESVVVLRYDPEA